MALHLSRHPSDALAKEGAARFAIAGGAILGALQLSAGIAINSIGLISAAADSLMDVLISAVNLFSIRLAAEPADASHPYGHGKIENLAGLLQGIVIGAMGLGIVAEALRRLIRGVQIQRVDWGIAVILISLVGSWVIARRLARVGHATDSVVLIADSLHWATDTWTILGVLVALLLTRVTGWPGFDPLIALGVGGVILVAAGRLLSRSIQDLMDTALPVEIRERVEKIIRGHPYAISFHDLRTRRAGSQKLIDFSLVMCRQLPLGEVHELVDHIEKEIENAVPNADVVIHAEPCHTPCPADPAHCALVLRGAELLQQSHHSDPPA